MDDFFKNLEAKNKKKEEALKQELEWVYVSDFDTENQNTYWGNFKKRIKSNPLVPIGAFLTCGVLALGLKNFYQGNQRASQIYMRWRVGLQYATVCCLIGGMYFENRERDKNKE